MGSVVTTDAGRCVGSWEYNCYLGNYHSTIRSMIQGHKHTHTHTLDESNCKYFQVLIIHRLNYLQLTFKQNSMMKLLYKKLRLM